MFFLFRFCQSDPGSFEHSDRFYTNEPSTRNRLFSRSSTGCPPVSFHCVNTRKPAGVYWGNVEKRGGTWKNVEERGTAADARRKTSEYMTSFQKLDYVRTCDRNDWQWSVCVCVLSKQTWCRQLPCGSTSLSLPGCLWCSLLHWASFVLGLKSSSWTLKESRGSCWGLKESRGSCWGLKGVVWAPDTGEPQDIDVDVSLQLTAAEVSWTEFRWISPQAPSDKQLLWGGPWPERQNILLSHWNVLDLQCWSEKCAVLGPPGGQMVRQISGGTSAAGVRWWFSILALRIWRYISQLSSSPQTLLLSRWCWPWVNCQVVCCFRYGLFGRGVYSDSISGVISAQKSSLKKSDW